MSVSTDQREHDQHAARGENNWFTCGLCDDESDEPDEPDEPDEDAAYDVAVDQALSDSYEATGAVDNWRQYL